MSISLPPVLVLQSVSKLYANGTLANDNVSMEIAAGEIHAVIGENGAGKSTLMKLLYGLEQPSSGRILLHGRVCVLRDPRQAIAAGIGLVPQHLQLVPSLTVTQNVVLGSEPTRGLGQQLLHSRAAVQAVSTAAQRFGFQLDPYAVVGDLSVGARQRVEILKTLYRGARIVMLDEPSAVLSEQEASALFASLRRMAEQGLTVLLITHKIREIRTVCDRFTVLRGGRVTGGGNAQDFSDAAISAMIVGRELSATSSATLTRRPPGQNAVALVGAHGLTVKRADGRVVLNGVSFEIAAGEILGVAGVEGNGQDVLAHVLCGLRAPSQGHADIEGVVFTSRGVRRARAVGVAATPEDRLHDGVAPAMSIIDNAMAVQYHQAPLSRRGWLDLAAMRGLARSIMARCQVAAAAPEALIGTLSGGNMQKIVLGREIASAPRFLIASQPTRGVDIGAAQVLHEQLCALRDTGAAILLISADLDELLALSDRIMVMSQGEIVAHFPAQQVDPGVLGGYMTGALRAAAAAALLASPFTALPAPAHHEEQA